jgi:site-specific recombinase XerD
MTNCVLCKREPRTKLRNGVCLTCYSEYRAMVKVEEEPYALVKRGDARSCDLMGFLQYLRRHEVRYYQRIWDSYACVRRLAFERRLPSFSSRSEWLSWAAEALPSPSRYARAMAHYLAYKGFEPDPRDRKVWFEEVMTGETPAQTQRVPEEFRNLLREYLVDLRVEEHVRDCTLDSHGRNLIAFFEWLVQHGLDRDLSAVLPEHITAYLAGFKTDGVTQGGRVVPGHSKTPWTVAKRASVLRAFFCWAEAKRLCSTSPAYALPVDRNRRTQPLPEPEVVRLIEQWTAPETPPRTAVAGMMLLIYGLFPRQLLALNHNALDLEANLFHGLQVPVPIPPVLRPVLTRYLTWRNANVSSPEDHSLVVSWQKGRYARAKPTILVPMLRPYGVSPRQLRVTALANTIQHGSLKLLAVFGMEIWGMKRYRDLARLAEHTRKVTPKPNLW